MIRLRKLAVVAVLVALAACGGKKRPPAVLTDPAGGAGGRPPVSATPERDETIDAGPDVQPLSGDAATASDFPITDATDEGGPLADVYFRYDQADLSDEGRATLEKHALWLQNHRQAKVTIEGHCDERGTVDYNLALGDRRAHATRDYLASLGVSTDRMQTVSYGKERPLEVGSDEAAYSKNRRAHFVVSR